MILNQRFKPVPMDVMERHFPLQTSHLIFDLNIFVILTGAQWRVSQRNSIPIIFSLEASISEDWQQQAAVSYCRSTAALCTVAFLETNNEQLSDQRQIKIKLEIMWIIPSGIIIDNLQLYGRLNPTFADYTSPCKQYSLSLYCHVANSLQSKYNHCQHSKSYQISCHQIFV